MTKALALVDLELARLAGQRRTHLLLVGFGVALLVVFVAQHDAIASERLGRPYGVLGHGQPMLERLGAYAIAALVAVVTLTGAGAIADERERGTLELLRASPLSASGIVIAKLAALLVVALAAIAVALPSFAAAMAMGGVDGVEVAAAAVSAGASALVAGSFALLASAACRRAAAAVALALAMCGVAWVADRYVEDVAKLWGRARPLHLVPATSRGALPASLLAPDDPARATLARSIGAWLATSAAALALAARLVHQGDDASRVARLVGATAAPGRASHHRADDVAPFAQGDGGRSRPERRHVVLATWLGAAIALVPAALVPTWPRTLLAIGWPLAVLALALRGAEAAVRERRSGALDLLLASPMSSRSLVRWMLASADGLGRGVFRALALWLVFGAAHTAAGPRAFATPVWGWLHLELLFPLMGLVAMRLDLEVARAAGLVVGMRLSPRHARAAILVGMVALASSAHVAGALAGRWMNPARLEPWKLGLAVLATERPHAAHEDARPTTAHPLAMLESRAPGRGTADPNTVHFLVLASHLGFAVLAAMGVRLAFVHRASELIGRGHAPRSRRAAQTSPSTPGDAGGDGARDSGP